MYINYQTWKTSKFSINSLLLDNENPRINEKTLNQTQIIKVLIKYHKVYELAKKISEIGYFKGERPTIYIKNKKK